MHMLLDSVDCVTKKFNYILKLTHNSFNIYREQQSKCLISTQKKKMSHHRKVHSQGNIPFSWEDKPGVSKSCKVTHCDQYCPIDVGLFALNRTSPPSDTGGNSTKILVHHDKKVPPPPPCSIQLLHPKRSTSMKGLKWWQEDPFLAAYKECTKSSGGNGKLSSSEGRKNSGSSSKLLVRKKKISFSCKSSSEVRDDSLVKLCNLPPLPKNRIRGRQDFVSPLEEYW
ncbi:hypothetical protein PTKIN_Ptkin07bG0258500 [Pterospermum kingtungense]